MVLRRIFTFSIDSESKKYIFRVSGYTGNAGDSILNSTISGTDIRNGMKFRTADSDNDNSGSNFAGDHVGGWWFNYCQHACLTCRYVLMVHLVINECT